MVQLQPMQPQDFEAYAKESIAEYAQENIKSGRWRPDEAQQQAEAQYKELLPDGVATKNNYIYSVVDEQTNEKVGMLWFAVEERSTKFAFVYDVIIFPQFRRRGYAEQAFRLLEGKVRELGLSRISLHVFGHNHGARALYEKLGYQATNIQMSKELES